MTRSFFYVVDRLTKQNAVTLKRALDAVPDIKNVTIWLAKGVVEVKATRDVEESIKLACSVAGTLFRTKTDKKKAW